MPRATTIADDNDYVEVSDPIRAVDPADGLRKLYHGTDVEALIAADPASNTPIGSLRHDSAEIGTTGRYAASFDGAQIAGALAALADGATVYRVIRSTAGNFRRADPLTYRKSVPSDD